MHSHVDGGIEGRTGLGIERTDKTYHGLALCFFVFQDY